MLILDWTWWSRACSGFLNIIGRLFKFPTRIFKSAIVVKIYLQFVTRATEMAEVGGFFFFGDDKMVSQLTRGTCLEWCGMWCVASWLYNSIEKCPSILVELFFPLKSCTFPESTLGSVKNILGPNSWHSFPPPRWHLPVCTNPRPQKKKKKISSTRDSLLLDSIDDEISSLLP
jgi:hypothetical protein